MPEARGAASRNIGGRLASINTTDVVRMPDPGLPRFFFPFFLLYFSFSSSFCLPSFLFFSYSRRHFANSAPAFAAPRSTKLLLAFFPPFSSPLEENSKVFIRKRHDFLPSSLPSLQKRIFVAYALSGLSSFIIEPSDARQLASICQ